jgi:flagellar basal body-associated protein FliL
MEKDNNESAKKHREDALDELEGEKSKDKEFKIPPRRRSIIARILVILAIVVIIAAVGIGAYLYQKPGSFLAKKPTNTTTNNSAKNTPSVNQTTDINIDSDAKSLIEDVNTANAVNANYQPVSPTTSFDPSTNSIYVTIQTKNFTTNHQVKVEWYYVDTDTFIDDGTYAAQTGINNVAFHLEQPAQGSWPDGDYQIKIYVDGKLAQIARFKVEGTLTGSDATTSSSDTSSNATE